MNGSIAKIVNTKNIYGNKKRFLSASALVTIGMLALSSPAQAGDNAWVLEQTGGKFDTDVSVPKDTRITQHTMNAVGEGDLDIDRDQRVFIDQPGRGARFVAIDRENDPAYLRGQLNANGQVWVLDRDGVFFGADAVINVGGIVASTGDLINRDEFMNGANPSLGNFGVSSVVNNGTINVAEAGLAAFVAPHVVNNGVINARMGRVVMAAGEKVTLDLYGDNLVEVTVGGELADALVEQSGKIDAEGGVVTLTAAAAKGVVDNVINMSGVITVASAEMRGGKIVLKGGNAGTVKVSGTMDASGDNGSVAIDGARTEFTGLIKAHGVNAKIDVSGRDLSLGGVIDVSGAGSTILFDPVIFTINAGEAATIVTALSGGGVVGVTAEEQIIVNAAIDSSAQGSAAILYFGDEGGAAGLRVDLNSGIILGVLQALQGDATLVNVGAGGLIQNGVDVAQAGTTVNVAAGLYGESVEVNKTLSLSGGGTAVVLPNSPGFHITADNVSVDGFVVFGADDGIFVDNANFATLSNNLIALSSDNGIRLLNSAGSTLTGNSILVSGASGVDVSGGTFNFLLGNIITGATDGVRVNGGGTPIVAGNLISGVTSDGVRVDGADNAYVGLNMISGSVDDGIDMRNTTGTTTVQGNLIDGALFAFDANGIEIDNAAGLSVTLNTVNDAGWDGIKVLNSNGAQISDNTVNDSNLAGLSLFNSSGATVSGNTVNNAGGSGIHSDNNDSLLIAGNTIDGAALFDGIHHINSADAIIVGNIVDSANRFGILSWQNSGTNLIAGNIVTNTATLDGIQVRESSGDDHVAGNIVDGTGVNGIGVFLTDGAHVSGNVITNAGWDGVNVIGSDGVLVTDNTISGSQGASGVAIIDSDDNLVDGNVISDSARLGIYVGRGDNVSVTGNTILNSGIEPGLDWSGIHVEQSDGATIAGNLIDGATQDGINIGDPINFGVTGNTGPFIIDSNVIRNVDRDGIYVHTTPGVVVTDNVIGAGGPVDNIGDEGIDVNNSDFSFVNGNIIAHTVSNGISFNPSDFITVALNDIFSVGGYGITVSHGTGAGIFSNTIAATDKDGIRVHRNEGVEIAGNIISDTYDDAMEVTFSDHAFIHDNVTFDLGDDGIDVENSNDATISGNFVDTTDENGIEVEHSSDVSIKNNEISNTTQSGIFALDTNNAEIDENTIAAASLSGIELNDVDNITLFDNLIRNNGANGLFVSGPDSGDIVLAGNDFRDNPVGAHFESGDIDLTGDANIFTRGEIGMLFRPYEFKKSGSFAPMNLVDKTIGTSVFENQSIYFVELDNGAFFNPGRPTILDGMHASYNGFVPDNVGGVLTQAEYDAIEDGIFHYRDRKDLGLFFFGAVPSIDQTDIFNDVRIFSADGGGLSITITGLPLVVSDDLAARLAGISPAAGGGGEGVTDETETDGMASIEPAAGDSESRTCWGDAVAAARNGLSVNYSFGGDPAETLNDASNCQSGDL